MLYATFAVKNYLLANEKTYLGWLCTKSQQIALLCAHSVFSVSLWFTIA